MKRTRYNACVIPMLCVGIVYVWNVFRQPVMDHYGRKKTVRRSIITKKREAPIREPPVFCVFTG